MTDFYKKNDNLLRDKLTQHEFAQTPNAWENMSALLDQHPVVPKRAVGYWWSVPFVTAAALAGVIGLGMYFTPTSAPITNSSAPVAEQMNVKESFVAIAPNVSNANPSVNRSINTTEKTTSEQVQVAEEKAPKTLDQPTKKVVVKSAVVASTSPATSTKKTTTAPTVANVSTPNTISQQEKKNETPLATDLLETNQTTVATNKKRKVKTTRTEVIYQYSTTPLRALQEKRKMMEKQNTIGNFGIGDELNTKKSPLKAAVFGGASAKLYGATKDFSVMPFAGVSASYRIAKHHGIQTGVQYKSMGNLTQNSSKKVTDPTTYMPYAKPEPSIQRIDLLEVPLVYQFHPHPKYNLQAGVKGAWLMNVETGNPDLNNLSNAEMGISEFDFSLLLGMEYCFNEHWSMGIQYSLGLINLTQKASNMHNEEVSATIDAGNDPQYNINALTNDGELIVPVHSEATGASHQALKVPNQLRNNDVQVLLKYTF